MFETYQIECSSSYIVENVTNGEQDQDPWEEGGPVPLPLMMAERQQFLRKCVSRSNPNLPGLVSTLDEG